MHGSDSRRYRDGNRQHHIADIGDSPLAGQRRWQATLAQHGRGPGNPVHRATGIGRHADQGESSWHHPADATQSSARMLVVAHEACGKEGYCMAVPYTNGSSVWCSRAVGWSE